MQFTTTSASQSLHHSSSWSDMGGFCTWSQAWPMPVSAITWNHSSPGFCKSPALGSCVRHLNNMCWTSRWEVCIHVGGKEGKESYCKWWMYKCLPWWTGASHTKWPCLPVHCKICRVWNTLSWQQVSQLHVISFCASDNVYPLDHTLTISTHCHFKHNKFPVSLNSRKSWKVQGVESQITQWETYTGSPRVFFGQTEGLWWT